jgi:hypothetical protein
MASGFSESAKNGQGRDARIKSPNDGTPSSHLIWIRHNPTRSPFFVAGSLRIADETNKE